MQILENYRNSCNSINLQGAEDSRRNRFKKIYPETPQNYSFHYLVDASSCDTTRMMSLSLSISRNISKLLVSNKQKHRNGQSQENTERLMDAHATSLKKFLQLQYNTTVTIVLFLVLCTMQTPGSNLWIRYNRPVSCIQIPAYMIYIYKVTLFIVQKMLVQAFGSTCVPRHLTVQ